MVERKSIPCLSGHAVGKRTTEAASRIMALTEYQNRNQNDILVSIHFQSANAKRKKNTERKSCMVLRTLHVPMISAKSLAVIFEARLWFKLNVEKISSFFNVAFFDAIMCVCLYWHVAHCIPYATLLPWHFTRFRRRKLKLDKCLVDSSENRHRKWASYALVESDVLRFQLSTSEQMRSQALNVFTVCVCRSVNDDKFFGQF